MDMGSKGEHSRQRIIDAADRLFYIKGFNQTSFSDIAEAAGVARGNFYYYFKTKDDILQAVIEKRAEDIRRMLEDWEASYPDPRDRLRRYVTILTKEQQHIEKFGCPMGTLCTELAKLRHARQTQAAEMFELFRCWLEKQFRLLGHKDDARDLALHLMAREQGAAIIANAYHDSAFLQREADDTLRWLDTV